MFLHIFKQIFIVDIEDLVELNLPSKTQLALVAPRTKTRTVHEIELR